MILGILAKDEGSECSANMSTVKETVVTVAVTAPVSSKEVGSINSKDTVNCAFYDFVINRGKLSSPSRDDPVEQNANDGDGDPFSQWGAIRAIYISGNGTGENGN